MLISSRFIYNDNASDGGAGAAPDVELSNEVGNEKVDTSAAPAELVLPEEIQQQLKEYQELKAWKAANTKAPEKTAEEIEKESEADRANFIKFSVDNNLLKIDELTKYETLKVREDADLVFESFIQDFKDENPDIKDEQELAEAAKDEFNKIYKLTSENEKAKEKGLAKLAKEAKEIRNPYESKVTEAQTSYNEEKNVRQKMPDFEKFIDTQINKNAPEKVLFKVKRGETEIPIEVELTKEDREAIAKEFKTPKTFFNYNKSVEETEKALDKKIQGWIKVNKFESALEKAAEIFEGVGVKNGSSIGAEHPFAMQQGKVSKLSNGLTLEQSNERVAEARSRFN